MELSGVRLMYKFPIVSTIRSVTSCRASIIFIDSIGRGFTRASKKTVNVSTAAMVANCSNGDRGRNATSAMKNTRTIARSRQQQPLRPWRCPAKHAWTRNSLSKSGRFGRVQRTMPKAGTPTHHRKIPTIDSGITTVFQCVSKHSSAGKRTRRDTPSSSSWQPKIEERNWTQKNG